MLRALAGSQAAGHLGASSRCRAGLERDAMQQAVETSRRIGQVSVRVADEAGPALLRVRPTLILGAVRRVA